MEAKKKMGELSAHRIFRAEDIIFSEGDQGDCAFLIEEGQVSIHKFIRGEEVVMATLGQGEIFGEMAILDGLARSASAKALCNCRLMIINRDQIFDQLLRTNPVTHLLIKILLRRIRNTTEKLANANTGKKESNLFFVNGSFQPANVETAKSENTGDKLALDRIRLGSELQQALVDNEFILNYQPIIDVRKGSVAGFEALIRWNSKTRGLVPPNDFIDLLEESSLIFPVGSWIQSRALQDLCSLKEKMKLPLFMSLNISVRQLENKFFLDELETLRKKFGLNANEIKLEVTERILMDGQVGLNLLTDACALGYLVSIDDFGTGYSNFQFLTKIGFSSIKIDKTLFHAAMKDPKTDIILKGISEISHGLDLDLIAEGIETEKERDYAIKLDFDYVQGYFYSRPRPVDTWL